LEKEWKALKSLEFVYRESVNKTSLGDCKLPAIVVVKLAELLRPFYY